MPLNFLFIVDPFLSFAVNLLLRALSHILYYTPKLVDNEFQRIRCNEYFSRTLLLTQTGGILHLIHYICYSDCTIYFPKCRAVWRHLFNTLIKNCNALIKKRYTSSWYCWNTLKLNPYSRDIIMTSHKGLKLIVSN